MPIVITVADAKKHCRVDHSDDDSYIEQLILVATVRCEEFQHRKYLPTEVIEKLDKFSDVIRPRYSPLISAIIKYIDTEGVLRTLAVTEYDVDIYSEPGRIEPAYTKSWPSTRSVMGAVALTYQAGYQNAESVPSDFKHAIRLLVGHWYEHRETVTEAKLSVMPVGVDDLLWLKRIF